MSVDGKKGVLVLAAVGVVLVSTQIKPLRRIASAVLGRIYLQTVVAQGGDSKEADLEVTGLFIHPGKVTNRL
jgi:hypothetical protein